MRLGKIASIIVLAALSLLTTLDVAAAAPQPSQAQSALAIARLLSTYTNATPPAGQRSIQHRNMVLRFYGGNDNHPVWSSSKRPLAAELLEQLRDAQRYGLRADEYTVQASVSDDTEQSADLVARYDVSLTAAALRFLTDLHFGRTPPDFEWYGGKREPDLFDPVDHLRMALDRGTFGPAVTAAEPKVALYGRVKQTLENYRELERKFRQFAPLPALPAHQQTDNLLPYTGMAELRQRLVLLGDLQENETATSELASTALEAGLRNFQLRHGLEQDGILGKATMSALAVPLSQRVRQLELTMERLRWMPDLPPGQMIVVNLPSYRLWALDTKTRPGSIEAEMRVIVGNAARTPTPLFIAQMRYLEFNPAWNVPRSIEVQELIPKLARDPELLSKENFELVPRDTAAATTSDSPLTSLRAGSMRLRQRPGPRNPLGALKFGMPNPQSIYLHGTPAKALFARTRRDFSHGCIRLEHPEELAVFVLRNEAGWDRAHVLAATEPGPTRTVMLSKPIPVVLLYATALADRQGRAIFLPDAYGLDQKLASALESERHSPSTNE